MKGKRRRPGPIPSERGGLLKAWAFSFFLHMALAVLLSFNLKPGISKGVPYVYRVTIRPFSTQGDGIPRGSSSPALRGPSQGLPTVSTAEKVKPVWDPKSSETARGIKPPQKKTGKKVEKPEKGESLEKGKNLKSLQEAMNEIHKKVALDEIRKRVARRETTDKQKTGEGKSDLNSSQEPVVFSSKGSPLSGPKSGTGTGLGPPGLSTGGSTGGSLWGSSVLESKLNEYYSMIWARIKEEWTLPENLPKGKIDLETTVVIVIDRIGKVQKSWIEKRSGNALYDQMAIRAIKKAEPFPPIPKEFSDDTFEIGIRFHPE